MTERYSFAVDKHLVDGSVVWSQDNVDTVNSTLTDTMNEGYITAEEDSPTRYLSVLDTSSEISLENLNITFSNPKLEVEDPVEPYTSEDIVEQHEDTTDQVVVFSVEGSDELYGIQVVQDEEGNLQKYQFQFRKNEDGQLEAIPETITLIPMDEDGHEALEERIQYAEPQEENSMHIFVQEDNSREHILPDTHVEEEEPVQGDNEDTAMYQSEEIEEVDIKPGVLQLQSIKQEIQESHLEYETGLVEEPDEVFTENLENQQMSDFQALPESVEEHPEAMQEPETMEEQSETNFEFHAEMEEERIQSEENSMSESEYQEKESDQQSQETVVNGEEFERVEISPDMSTVQRVTNIEVQELNEDYNDENLDSVVNDSDENDYQIVEGLHITGDVEGDVPEHEHVEKQANSNILRHALKMNKDSPKLVKKDNKLYLYVVQHPEKENVDSLSLEMSNLFKPKANPRSILKSSHAMFQAKNEIEANPTQDERLNKRFSRCKEAMQAMIFHNFINKTTIPQAPVRKSRLPRKQKIKPVERMDEEIVVQEVMVSSNGFVEAVAGGVNKENLAVTEYVELTDSDDDYDPKKVNRKKKKHRRKKIEITISDESDSHDSVIELEESDEETNKVENKVGNNNTPPKRRRGRPPKNQLVDSPTSAESPAKKSRVEATDNPTKPEIPCPKCDKTFPSQNSLKTHLQHHNLQSSIKRALPEYKYKCDKCEKTFINSILLKKHMCSKLFNCAACKKNFPDLPSLNVHKRTHAKEQMVKNTEVAKVSPKKKTAPAAAATTGAFKVPKTSGLKCKTCGKLCSSMQNLNVHLKTHREFVCGTCSKIFGSQLLLEKHVRENCVKSPQSSRRLIRIKSGGDVGKKSPVKAKNKGTSGSPGKKSTHVSARLLNILRVKCDDCGLQFPNHRAFFTHKVVKHGLEIPDKAVLQHVKVTREHTGIKAAPKLQNVCKSLQWQFSE